MGATSKGYLTPSTLPSNTRRIVIEIPDDAAIFDAVEGQISALLNERQWRFTPSSVDWSSLYQVIMTMVRQFLSEEECGMTLSFRINGLNQLQYNTGAGWQTILDLDDWKGRTPELRNVTSPFFHILSWKYTDEDVNAWRVLTMIDKTRIPTFTSQDNKILWRYTDETPAQNRELLEVEMGRSPELRVITKEIEKFYSSIFVVNTAVGTTVPFTAVANYRYRFTFPTPTNINNVLMTTTVNSGIVYLQKIDTTILGQTNITNVNTNVTSTHTEVFNQYELRWSSARTVSSVRFFDQVTVLQWKYADEPSTAWRDIFTFPEIAGAAGVSGKTPEFRTNAGQFQWKYTDEAVTAWRNLFAVPSNGAPGAAGADGRSPVMSAEGGLIKWRYQDEPPSAAQTLIDVCGVCDQEDNASLAVGVLQYLQELLTFSVMKRRNGTAQPDLVQLVILLFGVEYPIAGAIADFIYNNLPSGVTPDEVTANFPIPTRALMARGLAEFFNARGSAIFDLTLEFIATIGEVARIDSRLKWRDFVTTFTPAELQVAVQAYQGVPQPVYIQPRTDNQAWRASGDKHLNTVVQTGQYAGNTTLGYSASYSASTTDATTYTYKMVYNMNVLTRVNSVKIVVENSAGSFTPTTFTCIFTYLSIGAGVVTHTASHSVPILPTAQDVFFGHPAVENVKYVTIEIAAGRFFRVFEVQPLDNNTPPSNPPWLECWQNDRAVLKHPGGGGTITFDVVLNNPPAGPTFNVDVLLHDGTGCVSGMNQQFRSDTRIYDGSLRYTMTFSLEGRTTITVFRTGLFEVDLNSVVWS